MKRNKVLQIAIDGPVAAGKSTVAKRLAEALGLLYIDTGAMYRALAWAAYESGIEWQDEAGMSALVEGITIELKRPWGKRRDGRSVTVLLNGEDVSWEIRKADIAEGASIVSQYPEVRRVLVREQQRLANGHPVVMEGRDIGTRVLPQAAIKVFMSADLSTRVRRKQDQLQQMGQALSLKTVKEGVLSRDNREMTRKVDPLRPAEDAWVMDTTTMSIEEVVTAIIERTQMLGGLTGGKVAGI